MFYLYLFMYPLRKKERVAKPEASRKRQVEADTIVLIVTVMIIVVVVIIVVLVIIRHGSFLIRPQRGHPGVVFTACHF